MLQTVKCTATVTVHVTRVDSGLSSRERNEVLLLSCVQFAIHIATRVLDSIFGLVEPFLRTAYPVFLPGKYLSHDVVENEPSDLASKRFDCASYSGRKTGMPPRTLIGRVVAFVLVVCDSPRKARKTRKKSIDCYRSCFSCFLWFMIFV
jgi:hypothetical protein